MGVLEDAIRDHLELKRRHGASDEEVQREEAEALGPARRDFEGRRQPEPEQTVEPIERGEEPDAEPEPLEGETQVHEPPTSEPRPAERPAALGEQEADFADEEEADRRYQRPPRDFDFD